MVGIPEKEAKRKTYHPDEIVSIRRKTK